MEPSGVLLLADDVALTVSPNPLAWDSSSAVVEWKAPKLSCVQLCVAQTGEPEQLMAQQDEGRLSANWLKRNAIYEFRLYETNPARRLLRQITVNHEPIPWDHLLDEITSQPLNLAEQTPAAKFVGHILSQNLLTSPAYDSHFRSWQRQGIHVTPVHFYQPIPDTRAIPESCWDKKETTIDFRIKSQLHLLKQIFPRYANEYNSFPVQAQPGNPFHLENGRFATLDSLTAYCIVRHFRPRRIIEIGGGYSSLILGKAAVKNGKTSLVTVEPYPVDFLRAGFPGLTQLHEVKVESLPLEFFNQLGERDILFIDSSHVVKTGGDVNYLFLEILPRLAPGVLVHVHDVNLPNDYPKHWVCGRLRFWTEQYLLQAFLTYNSRFEIVLSNAHLSRTQATILQKTFPQLEKIQGGSFWIRRKSSLASMLNDRFRRLFHRG